MGMIPGGNPTRAESGTNRSRILGRDLHDPKWMCVKAIGFVVIGLFASALILIKTPSWEIAVLLGLSIWAFARAYYFAFYVIEHYVDPDFRFAGLFSALRHVRKVLKDTNRNEPGRS